MINTAKPHALQSDDILAESSAVLTVINSIPALVANIDCNMMLQYCNDPFKKWFSIEGSIRGCSFPKLVGEDIFDQVQRHMGKVLTGDRAHFQISVASPQGVQYLDATLSPEFDARRQVKGFVFHCSDVTEKNRTERTLKDYFENANIGLHWVNSNGIIIWANPAELSMLGYREEEYVGHHISEFHARQEVIEDMLNRLSSKQALQNFEAEMICKDGSVRHVSINSTVQWEGERFVHTRCFTIDVTEQKLAARALEQSEEQFKSVANLVPLVIWSTDPRGKCNFLNVRWTETTGKRMEEGLGNKWLDFIHPHDRENVVTSLTKSFEGRRPFEAKFRYLNARGEYDISYVNSTPRFEGAGEFLGYIGILQNIAAHEEIKASLEKIVIDRTDDLRKKNAELKAAEKELMKRNIELQRSNSELESFSHIASHDLQEPLRKIQTFLALLREADGDKFSANGKQYLDRAHISSERMRALIHDLLEFSRATHSHTPCEKVELNDLINDILIELEHTIHEKHARIENHGLPALHVTAFQFHQLFLNLLSNALKFSRKGVDTVIELKSELIEKPSKDKSTRTFHHIMVKDNGIGFEQAFAEKIFEVFHRLHDKSNYEGTGIGLAICKKIVENHNGTIAAEGIVNVGATFHIYLPVTEDEKKTSASVNHNVPTEYGSIKSKSK
jgi:PAS domain S-box-containing protein